MSIETILTEEFIHRQEAVLESLDDHLQNSPLSKNKRLEELIRILKRGLSFGIPKGIFIEKCTRERIDKANKEIEDKWCMDFASQLNDSIQADIESKKKSKSRKKK